MTEGSQEYKNKIKIMTKLLFISRGVALDIIRQCIDLFAAGTGQNLGPSNDDIENQDPAGILDELSPDSEMFHWSNAVLSLLRVVYGILDNEFNHPEIGDE